MKIKQISIFIENSLGRLYEVTHALGEAGINIRATSLVDTADFGVLRLIVSDVATARRIMMEKHLPARIDDVVAVEIEDRPGTLGSLLKPLLDAKAKIDYMYAFTGFTSEKAVMVFRFSDNDKAIEILRKNGIRLLDAKVFGMLENASQGGGNSTARKAFR
ncbi:MAG: amino acid-binding protein [Proteobacteria bacterium]|nr:amino acid-binding protein [Pseudomonadota bacterium]